MYSRFSLSLASAFVVALFLINASTAKADPASFGDTTSSQTAAGQQQPSPQPTASPLPNAKKDAKTYGMHTVNAETYKATSDDGKYAHSDMSSQAMSQNSYGGTRRGSRRGYTRYH
jgi:hypothetical protein